MQELIHRRGWLELRGYVFDVVKQLVEAFPYEQLQTQESKTNGDLARQIAFALSAGFSTTFPEADLKLPFLIADSEVDILVWEMVLYDLHTYLIYLSEPAKIRPDLQDVYAGIVEKLNKLRST